MSCYRIRSWNIERNQLVPSYDSHAEVHGHKIHSVSKVPVWSDAFVCVGIHDAEHEGITQSFVFIRCRNGKLVPMPFEVNVSLHYARKRHKWHITADSQRMLWDPPPCIKLPELLLLFGVPDKVSRLRSSESLLLF